MGSEMYQNYHCEVDPKDPFKPLYQGTFEETVEVGGKTRRYLLYIPEGARPRRQVCLFCRRTARQRMTCGVRAVGV